MRGLATHHQQAQPPLVGWVHARRSGVAFGRTQAVSGAATAAAAASSSHAHWALTTSLPLFNSCGPSRPSTAKAVLRWRRVAAAAAAACSRLAQALRLSLGLIAPPARLVRPSASHPPSPGAPLGRPGGPGEQNGFGAALRAGERPAAPARPPVASGEAAASGGSATRPARQPGRACRALAGPRSRPANGPTLLKPQIRDIGSGNFGVAKLCRAKDTGELVAVKFIERGEKASGRQPREGSGRPRRLPSLPAPQLPPPAATRSRAGPAPSLCAPAPACRPRRSTRMWSGRSSTTACCRGTPTSCGSARCVPARLPPPRTHVSAPAPAAAPHRGLRIRQGVLPLPLSGASAACCRCLKARPAALPQPTRPNRLPLLPARRPRSS